MKKILPAIFLASLINTTIFSQGSINEGRNDSLIVTALSMINEDSLEANLQSLQDFGTRFLIAPNRKEVATWIMNKFLSYGIDEVRLDSFLCNTQINFPPSIIFDTTTWQYNVEARIEGTSVPEEEILILGHYDDAPIQTSPFENVPGADDNGSGTSAVLECARVIRLMEYQPAQTMIFLASAAEELMYYGDAGTEHYAAEALEAGRNIVMVLNNDMVSYDDGPWMLDLWNHTNSPEISELAVYIIENYTTLNYEYKTPVPEVGADLQPFLDAGYHGIYFMEHVFNPNYHMPGDTVENCNIPYLAEVTKLNLGCLLQSELTVGLFESRQSVAKFQVYPNPATDNTCILLDESITGSWSLRIMNMNNAEVFHQEVSQRFTRINLSALPSGLYLMVLNDGRKVLYEKLVISRSCSPGY